MFALDFGDIDKYVDTFTEDGVLDIGEGEWRASDTIRNAGQHLTHTATMKMR